MKQLFKKTSINGLELKDRSVKPGCTSCGKCFHKDGNRCIIDEEKQC